MLFDLQTVVSSKPLFSNENQAFFISNSFTTSLTANRTEIGSARGEGSE